MMQRTKIKYFLCGILFLLAFETVNGQLRPLDTIAYKSWQKIERAQLSDDGKWFIYKKTFFDQEEAEKDKSIFRLKNTTDGSETLLEETEDLRFFANGNWLMFRKTTEKDSRILMELKNKQLYHIPYDINISSETTLITWQQPYPKDADMQGFFRLCYCYAGKQDTLSIEGIKFFQIYDHDRSIICLRKDGQNVTLCHGRLGGQLTPLVLFRATENIIQKSNIREIIGKSPENFLLNSSKTGGLFYLNGSSIYTFSLHNNNCQLIVNLNDYTLPTPMIWNLQQTILPDHHRYVIANAIIHNPYPKVQKNPFEPEIWKWDDEIVQSRKKHQQKEYEGNPARYIIYPQTQTYFQILPKGFDRLILSPGKDDSIALATDKRPYLWRYDWKYGEYTDIYVVNLRNGHRRLLLAETLWIPTWSPDGQIALLYDCFKKKWLRYEVATDLLTPIETKYPIYNEQHDQPCPPTPYGIAGWTSDGKPVVYDRYDLWELPINNQQSPRSLTQENGRKSNIIFRLQKEQINSINTQKGLLLKSVNENSREEGIWDLQADGKLRKRISGAYALKIHSISKDRQHYLWTRESYQEFRDFWISGPDFKKSRRLTEANPQQKEYAWGKCQLTEWTAPNGEKMRGLLYLPENFDTTRRWPVVVQFYETHTEAIHTYYIPSPSGGMADISTIVSQGYVVFMPDVHFRVGEPGQSCYDAVISGTQMLIAKGIADSSKIALQGHSWSGYLAAYLVGNSSLFRCAILGAAVVNTTSCYGSIRDGSGRAHMIMYEDTQCRIGKSLWEAPDIYIKNSPLFYAHKITTPLLICHCDKDEAVPFSQGMEFYFAMRRLQKPAWLLNYRGEGHFLSTPQAKKDWTIKMSQFLDYYLKDAPLPYWMEKTSNVKKKPN
ncbi:MAG: prolyl oligopeptidase family serine peptidase [Odoribacter sp.]